MATPKTRFLALGIGKSAIIDLPRDVKDVLVADPKIANAVVRSAQRAYIIGAAVGQTNVVFFDADGQQVAAYDIAVKRDLNGVRTALKQMLPAAGIQAEGVGDGVMLTGSVSSPLEAQQAGDLAARLVGGADKVVNSIVVRSRDQVMLKVTVAEVRRDIIKQLGVDLSASMNYGTAAVVFNNTNPFTANNAPARLGQRLDRRGAEQSRFAVGHCDPARDGERGRGADAGGAESDGHLRRVRDIHFGRRISNSDRRHLPNHDGGRDRTMRPDGHLQEIRHLAQLHAGGADRRTDQPARDDRSVGSLDRKRLCKAAPDGSTIPSIKTRRAETTLEIPSGGSMAMAGLIQEQTKQAVNGMPGIDSLPIFGALFRSQDFVNNETELMVIVTPYVVRAVAQKELSRPDDGFAPASDSQSALLGPNRTGSTVLPPVSNPLGSTTATSASSLIETERPWPGRDGDRTMTNTTPAIATER